MNETNLSTFPGATPLLSSPLPIRLPRLLLGLALAVATFDLCFWGIDTFGFSVAVFFLALTGIVLSNRESMGKGRITVLLIALLLGAAFAATMETGFTNTLVLLILTVVLAGETYFGGIESMWGRWLSQGAALVLAPGRLFWLAGVLLESAFRKGIGGMGSLIGGCLLTFPALVLTLIFGSLLASGNAVFGSWTNTFFDWVWKELALYLDPARIALWCLIAFLVLPLLRPANIPEWCWKWTEQLPRLPEIIPPVPRFSAAVLS